MLNTVLVIKLESDIGDSERELKLLVNKITTALRYFESNLIEEKDGIYFVECENNKCLELYKKQKCMWLVNIYGHDDKEKCRLIDTISKDNTFEKVMVIFDSLSSNRLKSAYPQINSFESKIRSIFSFKIIEDWKIDVFNIVDKFNVKDEFRFDGMEVPKNINTKLQRIGLSELIEYISDHKLGGDEFNRFYNQFIECNRIKEYESFDKLLRTDIFKGVSDEFKDRKKIRRIRNIVCHNSIIDIEKFNEVMSWFEGTNSKINGIYNEEMKNVFGYEMNYDRNITLLIDQDIEKVNYKNIQLLFSELLNYCGYIYDSKNGYELKCYPSGRCDFRFKLETEDGLSFILRYKGNEQNENGKYIFTIICNENLDVDKIGKMRDLLINNIRRNKAMLINDYISTQYCNSLYLKINYIENIVRAYISIFYFFKDLDINKIEIKGNVINDGITINNNILYMCDFIDLIKILDNPPESKKVRDLSAELKKILDSSCDNKYERIEYKLKNISDTNAEVSDLIKIWGELYKYRTILAHSEYISFKEYISIKNIIESTLEKVEKIFFDEIDTTFDIKDKYDKSVIIKVLSDNIVIDINLMLKNIMLKINEHRYEFQELGIFRFNRLLNSLANNKVAQLSYTLTMESIKKYMNDSYNELNRLLDSNNYDIQINKNIVELGYTKYTNYRVVSSKEDILEERIGKLLKSIEVKIKEID